MVQGVTRNELRKVRAIVTLIGEENLPSLSNKEYQCLRGLHVYSVKGGDNELSLSVWSEPKDKKSAKCLFADKMSVNAFNAAVDYWRPKYSQ